MSSPDGFYFLELLACSVDLELSGESYEQD